MQDEIKTWLYDVKTCIEEIELFCKDCSFEHYANDLRTKRAIERNLITIGEAINRALQMDENLPVSDARKIVDTRNHIIHGYHKISDEIIWNILQTSLPVLKAEVIKLLQD